MTTVVRRPSRIAGPLYVGLDPSLTGYGVALLAPEIGKWSVDLISTKPDGEVYAVRLREIQQRLVDLLRPVKNSIVLICMERPAYAASGAFTGGLVHAATALALLEVFDVDDKRIGPALVASNTLKKFATGKGVGKKQLMVKWVLQKWGFDTDDDNLAEAFALAKLAAAVVSGAEHKYEQECVETVRRGMSWEPLLPQTSGSLTTQRLMVGGTRAPRRTSSVSRTPRTSNASPPPSRSLSQTASR